MDFPLNLDNDSSVPLFLQISRIIRERIESGILDKGTKLPSSYTLARSLKLSRSTVVKAYNDLLSQGYLESLGGGRTYVSGRVMDRVAFFDHFPENKVSDSGKYSDFAQRVLSMSVSGASAASAVDNEKVNFGAPPIDSLPLKAWKRIIIEECKDLGSNSNDWSADDFGLYTCRQAISSFLSRSRAIKCSPEQVLIFANCKEALMFVSRLLLKPGDRIAIENPSYTDPRNYFSILGANLVPVNIDDEGMIVSNVFELNPKPRLIYTTPVQDPTGIKMSSGRREKLVLWAEENDVMIWEEGWEGDYNYVLPADPALQGLGSGSHVFYGYCFWKLLYPLVTLGVLVVPPQMVTLCRKAKQFVDIQFSMLEQKALARFISEGYLERHISKSKSLFEKRRLSALENLLKLLREHIVIPKQSASLHLCIRFSQNFKSSSILNAAEKSGLSLTPTTPYYLAEPRSNEFILPFSLYTTDSLNKKIALFASLLK